MAVEQLKYDFDLNLSKAEKQLDQFFNKMEQKLDRASDNMEKKVAKASQPRATSQARAAGKEKSDLERKLREEDRIIERFEQQRVKRKERLDAMLSSSTLRGDTTRLRSQSFKEDDQLFHQAEAAYARFRQRQVEITSEASFKNLSVIQSELAKEEALYRQSVTALKGQHSANTNAQFAKARRQGKITSMAFNVQQMVEDYNYAGFRGLSNNLAFLGATLGGSAGLAIVAGVAAKGLWDLGKAMMGVGDAAAEMEARNQRALTTLNQIADLKQKQADIDAEFEIPRTMKDFEKRTAQLTKQEKRSFERPALQTLEQELRILNLMAEAEARRAEWVGRAARDQAAGGTGATEQAEADKFKAQYERLRKQLQRPDDVAGPGQIQGLVEELRKQIGEQQRANDLDREGIRLTREKLEGAKQITMELEKHDTLHDDIKSKLQDQISAEEQLVEASKKRMEAIDDTKRSFRDSVSDKILDHQTKQVEKHFDRQTERMVEFDKRRNEIMFKRMGGDSVPGLRARFDQWQERRSNQLKAEGERASYNAQARLARARAQQLRERAEDEAKRARGFAQAGNMPQADRMFDRSIQSYQKIMELQERFMDLEGNPARQQAFFAEYQQFAKIVEDLMNEQSKAHENFGQAHAETLQRLKEMEGKLLEIEAVAERLQFVDPGDLDRIKQMNAELEKMVGFLNRAADANPDKKGQMPAGGGQFSVPMDPLPGPGAKAGAEKAKTRAERASEAFAKRQAEVQANRDAAAQRRKEAHQKRLEASQRKAEKQPMKGDWGAMPKDPIARAQGYWPMIRQQVDKQEHDLRQVTGNLRNSTLRQRKLAGLRKESYDLKKELEGGASGKRAEEIANRMQGILKDVTGIDPTRPVRKAVEKITPRWSKQSRDGKWTHGEGMLPPSTFSPAGINATPPSNFRGPVPGPGVVNNVSNTVMNAHTVINTVQAPDATKLQREMQAKAKAVRARQGL